MGSEMCIRDSRPFGHSRISRACMGLQQGALRTLKRSEISAEFYSFPQKYVLGTSGDADPMDKWKATISSLLEISKDAQQEQQAGRRKLTDAEREAAIRRLEKEMKEASKMLEFEYAALLRDQIIALRGEK